MRQAGSPGPADVEFDLYVPFTATWRAAGGLLDPPRYAGLRGESGYLELRFHPHTGILTEAVLAAAPGILAEQRALAPRSRESDGLMPCLGPGETFPRPGDRLVIKAYPDYLYVCFGPGPVRWAGPDPVLFGLTAGETLTAIAAQWTGAERELVLAGR